MATIKRKANRPVRYVLRINSGTVVVYHPTKAEPLTMTEDEAGRRIAAAPDLLAACRSALTCLEHSDPPSGGYTETVIGEVRAAIRKATGDTP